MATSIEPVTVTFSEESSGWVSFKSFIQDGGVSLNNQYYTFKNTTTFDTNTPPNLVTFDFLLWKHHANETRNNFYGQQSDSHVDVLFNEESATVKSFASMKYEGSQAKITQDLTDPAYFNNDPKPGWYVESGNTDLQLAGEMEFKDKEGKWFSYMKGVSVETVEDLNSKEFSFQGIGILDNMVTTGNVFGCTDPLATNYNPLATDDDGSCTYPPYSCWECDGSGGCDEDTNPLNGPCNDYNTKAECLSNCGSGPPPPRYTLTINDITPPQQQINYSVSTFTKTNIIGDSVIPHSGTGTFPNSEYRLEISADTNYTVRASDFAIEFPSGTAGTQVGGPTATHTPLFFMDEFAGSGSGLGLGQGNDLGTGPLVYLVAFADSENPTYDVNWTGPSAANIVTVDCFIGTDMDDNIPGAPNWPTNMDVYMTDNGMSSGNLINAGIPGDLDIDINIIGSAQLISAGCTDPYASNYDSNATIDDGSCDYGGCTDPNATNYNYNAWYDDGSCVYPPVCGCTDNTLGINNSTIFSSRPVGYYGPALNRDINATVTCAEDCLEDSCISGQTGLGCCCEYDACNVTVQSMDGTLVVTNSNNATQNNGVCVITLLQAWYPSYADISINVYTGTTNDEVTGLHSIFWNPASSATGWGDVNTQNPNALLVHQNDSGIDPADWNIIGDLSPGDYHVRIDTGDDCHVWYDFTIGDDYTPPNNTYGCTDPIACNYNSAANIDDGSCDFSCWGCTDSSAYNYDPNGGFSLNDGSCCRDSIPGTIITTTDETPYGSGSTGGATGMYTGTLKITIPNDPITGIPFIKPGLGGAPHSLSSWDSSYYTFMSDYQVRYRAEYHDKSAGWSSSSSGCGNPNYNCDAAYLYPNYQTNEWQLCGPIWDGSIPNTTNGMQATGNVFPINSNNQLQAPFGRKAWNVMGLGGTNGLDGCHSNSLHGTDFWDGGTIGGYSRGSLYMNGDWCGGDCTYDAAKGFGNSEAAYRATLSNPNIDIDWMDGANWRIIIKYRTKDVYGNFTPWCVKHFFRYVGCVTGTC